MPKSLSVSLFDIVRKVRAIQILINDLLYLHGDGLITYPCRSLQIIRFLEVAWPTRLCIVKENTIDVVLLYMTYILLLHIQVLKRIKRYDVKIQYICIKYKNDEQTSQFMSYSNSITKHEIIVKFSSKIKQNNTAQRRLMTVYALNTGWWWGPHTHCNYYYYRT